MGKPGRGHARSSRTESIGARRRTRGTETSKYPEDQKSTETPRVAASERGSAQTDGKQFLSGLWDSAVRPAQIAERSGRAGQRG